MVRLLAGLLVQGVLFTALIFVPAWLIGGTLDWPRGWIAVGVLFFAAAAGGLWVQLTNPDLVRERTTVQAPKTAADGVATLIIAVSVIAWLVFVSWDVHRIHLLPGASAVSLWIGLAVLFAGVGVILWTFRVNTFAATVVKVQEERQQRVIDTGPYAFVRHPMYLGAIFFFAGLGLMLDSTAAALLAVPVFALAFVPRMIVEERVLSRDLAGYAEYRMRVRARLVPKVF